MNFEVPPPRDIKLENVLLHEDGTIKLTDFGWSNYIMDEEVRDTFCGTPVYLAPEMLLRKEHDHNVDLWCIGVMIFELINGKVPFNTKSKKDLEDSILRVKINWPTDMHPQAKDLVKRILHLNPQNRMQIEACFKHPFFTSHCTKLNDALIKAPLSYDDLEIYVMTKHTPNMEPTKKPKEVEQILPKISNPNVTGPINTGGDITKILEILEKEKKEVIKLNTIVKESNLKNADLAQQVENLNKKLTAREDTIKHLEEQGKVDINGLEKKNTKLLEEIEFLNDRIELHKEYYTEHLDKFDKDYKESQDDNDKKIDNTMNNFRESINQINKNENNKDEIAELKKNFEEEIERLKERMAKERENYNFVIESNMKELKQLSQEKSKIKESTGKYYEKLIHKYEIKIKSKDSEIEELKKKK